MALSCSTAAKSLRSRNLAPFAAASQRMMSQLHTSSFPSSSSSSGDKSGGKEGGKKSKGEEKKGTRAGGTIQAQTHVHAAGDSRESIAITPRTESYSRWYNDLVIAADMLDASPVRGCMVIKPWGMGVWDLLRGELDTRISDTGAENAYFPLLIPQSFLSKEADHVQGFATECAVVTHHRLWQSEEGGPLVPDPAAKLEEPLIVRPTSETIIWHMFGKWIRSHRDLPLKVNQWANVLRWEMRTRPFLRSMEFLWQEGHTAHTTQEEALLTARESLDVYAEVCENVLAIPVVQGTKSPSERFAGAVDTFTIEALMQNGWALQSGTSHFLGQNFAKAFEVTYQSETGSRELVWATSWGVSTRLIGALLMTHSDDKGVVLPPVVAPVQVIIVPIQGKDKERDTDVSLRVTRLQMALKKAGIRVKVDARSHLRPGAKYFEWERKGVPLRLDVGPRDIAANTASMTTRHSSVKRSISISNDDEVCILIKEALAQMQTDLLDAARARLVARTFRVHSYAEMESIVIAAADAGTTGEGERAGGESEGQELGFFLVPWKCDADNEMAIKDRCKATVRCYPFEHNITPPEKGMKCFYSGEQATHMAIFARAY